MDSLLFPPGNGIQITSIEHHSDQLTIRAKTFLPSASCPKCGQISQQVHSRYTRSLHDLPMLGKRVQLHLTVRRFRCSHTQCAQQLFCERLPNLVEVSARTTQRLQQSQRDIAHALGGEAGSRLAHRLGMPVRGDTLLRRLRALRTSSPLEVQAVGIDDFALRKGQSYGTIVCDLQTHQPQDLLPNREVQTVANWLKEHPRIRILSRDRASCYAQAASQGAPQAIQIADRWHLLKNLREAVEVTCRKKNVPIGNGVVPEPVRWIRGRSGSMNALHKGKPMPLNYIRSYTNKDVGLPMIVFVVS